ncbi:hypothetical protein PoB_004649700 [Plakobranchus ocellatus]|uniref:Uncharacterized protein n=1 Tax=Plakobranchus ocellatus TaxID=259542 RepID=A0AAV4BKS9_9GAST|nr:hypothetical protein PoB_004649700 [Plakobranchus ocellatus]
MLGLIPISWITQNVCSIPADQLKISSRRIRPVSSSSESECPCQRHLHNRDFIQPSDVNTGTLAFRWTGGSFWSHIAVASSRNTLLCRQVHLP